LRARHGDARPDVVHVLTPPASHAGLAIEALECSDVFVEADGANVAG
jgi:predicted dehydrogenase